MRMSLSKFEEALDAAGLSVNQLGYNHILCCLANYHFNVANELYSQGKIAAGDDMLNTAKSLSKSIEGFEVAKRREVRLQDQLNVERMLGYVE